MKYEDIINQNADTAKAEEPSIGAYAVQTLPNTSFRHEWTVEEKISYLRANLSPRTVDFLEKQNWMVDQPFPYDDDIDDDSWIDEVEAVGDSDIVPEEIVKHDREVWLSVR